MRERCYFLLCFGLIMVNSLSFSAYAQLGFDLKIDKPKPYEERVLRGEKSQDKPLRAQGRFFQNLTTHYNYFFNANTKINEVIDGAKAAFKDDYTRLLPFYNYSLDATSANSAELDSVIYKAQTGIVMHDLRNDWIDNLYLLWGAAWFLEKKFDSASLMFQFINYAFAEKEKDGYYKYIGSRMDGNNALTISTKEKNKNLVTPPSRNNAFIWQARTMIEMGNMAEAGSLIATLKNDPLFPERLDDDLEEVQAYWFYKQGMWDSSATHLLNALDQAKNKQEKARWEYLAAQMLERSGKIEDAQKWYTRSIGHTTDPVMDIYARLNIVRIQKDTTRNYIDKNIAELLKMAKRDKYVDYRDAIYYMAAQMEMERNNFEAAQKHLLKSAKYNNNNLASGSKTYLLIADLSFDQKKYLDASRFYDSVKRSDLEDDEATRVEQRKEMLSRIVAYSTTISKHDSLQRIAALPEEERNDYINDLVKQLRKQQGLDDVAPVNGGFAGNSNSAPDLFSSQDQRGEWYFYNTNLKTQGNAKFKQNWGNRPNVDNWRRFSNVSQQLNNNQLTNIKGATKTVETNDQLDNTPTYESLLKNLPLTPEQLKASNDSIRTALISLGKVYLNEVEDYKSAIEIFEQLRTRFPDRDFVNEEVLFNLYYAYRKAGEEAKAEEIKKAMQLNYGDSRFTTIITTGKDPAAQNNTEEVTRVYEGIYDLFLEGRFQEAIEAKKSADSKYNTSKWEPQLLYIESVFHIRQRNDSVAKNLLQTIINQDGASPLAIKAQTMIDVLNRRKEIEAELTALRIERPVERQNQPPIQQQTPTTRVNRDSVINLGSPLQKDSSLAIPKKDMAVNNLPQPKVDTTSFTPPVQQPRKDTVISKPIASQPKLHSSGYFLDTLAKHHAMVILDKVDPLFVTEVQNAFVRYGRDRYYDKNLAFSLKDLDADKKILLIGYFNSAREAREFIERARSAAASEIMPWLKADKYSFYIVTDANLDILTSKKELGTYRDFLVQTLQVK